MNPLDIITKGFWAVAAFFGYQTEKLKHLNTPEMKKSDEAQKENNQLDENARIIKNRDLEAIRRKHSH